MNNHDLQAKNHTHCCPLVVGLYSVPFCSRVAPQILFSKGVGTFLDWYHCTILDLALPPHPPPSIKSSSSPFVMAGPPIHVQVECLKVYGRNSLLPPLSFYYFPLQRTVVVALEETSSSSLMPRYTHAQTATLWRKA